MQHQVGIVFETATPFDTPMLMKELVAWTLESFENKSMHPLLITANLIVIFLEIHPFQDGNGRLSRVLTTLILLRYGYAYVPYSSLESIIEKSKESYYLAIRQTQKTVRTNNPNWQPWILFFLRSLHKQVKILSDKIERERIVMATLPDLSVQIIEQAKAYDRVTIGEMVKLTGASSNTLKEHFRILTYKRYLIMHGRGVGVWYSLT